jgi:DNA-nicking Smr family endonuclease
MVIRILETANKYFIAMDANARDKILRYLEEHGVSDKDEKAASRSKKENSGIKKMGKKGLRKTIDLHGMVSGVAEQTLFRAMEECRKKGIKELLIIHGWGRHSNPLEGGVLKKLVRESFEHGYAPVVRGFKTALPKDGGEGATLVTLK